MKKHLNSISYSLFFCFLAILVASFQNCQGGGTGLGGKSSLSMGNQIKENEPIEQSNLILSGNSVTVSEGEPAEVNVSLNQASEQEIVLNWVVSLGSISGTGMDFSKTKGQIVIPAGQTNTVLSIDPYRDEFSEISEDFVLNFSNSGLKLNLDVNLTVTDGPDLSLYEDAYRWGDGTYSKSCKDYLEDALYHNEGSGLYWISNGNLNPLKAYCDMDSSSDGGGWTLVVGINGSDQNHFNASEVNVQSVSDRNWKGKFSDTFINNMKRDQFRFECESSKVFIKSVDFHSTEPTRNNPSQCSNDGVNFFPNNGHPDAHFGLSTYSSGNYSNYSCDNSTVTNSNPYMNYYASQCRGGCHYTTSPNTNGTCNNNGSVWVR